MTASGSGQSKSATRPCSAAGRPMCTSAPSGPAISSRSIAPTVLPVTRLITSPARNPNVFTWYPCPEPGGHPGLLTEQLAQRTAPLASGAELRPVPGHRGIGVEAVAADQHGRARGDQALAHREHVDQRVPLPRTAAGPPPSIKGARDRLAPGGEARVPPPADAGLVTGHDVTIMRP